MLDAVADKYGRDSVEHEQAGGKRKSARRKTGRSTDATNNTIPASSADETIV